ncbi:hypothetical protein AB0M28_19480 [Streptomyces sp. NPDC051940]|uniref:hypothetical protein n=1 Tax=Streptomyces sp. NPDC051940 TaxID=3155675 RepID=UPI00342DB9CC
MADLPARALRSAAVLAAVLALGGCMTVPGSERTVAPGSGSKGERDVSPEGGVAASPAPGRRDGGTRDGDDRKRDAEKSATPSAPPGASGRPAPPSRTERPAPDPTTPRPRPSTPDPTTEPPPEPTPAPDPTTPAPDPTTPTPDPTTGEPAGAPVA